MFRGLLPFRSSVADRVEVEARARRIARLLHALGEPVVEAGTHARRLAGRLPDGPRGERLAILEHRERVDGGGDRAREAWVLRVVLGWSERDAAKAMDCSRTALRVHLEAGAGRFDAQDVEALRRGLRSVDAGPREVHSASGGRGSWRSVSRPLGPLIIAVSIAVVLALSIGWLG